MHTGLADMVGRMYEAAFDDRLWEGLAASAAAVFGAPSAIFHLRASDGTPRIMDLTSNMFPTSTALREQSDYWRRHDLWVAAAKKAGSGKVLVNQDMFPDREFMNTGFYQDWVRHCGIFNIVGGMTVLTDGRVATFGIHSERGKPFNESSKRIAESVLKHYVKVLEIRERVRAEAIQREMSLQSLGHGNTAALLVSFDYRMLHATPLAEDILRDGDALCLEAGCVKACDRLANDVLMRAVKAAAFLTGPRRVGDEAVLRLPAGQSLALPRGEKPPLTVMVAPVREATLAVDQGAALLLLRDPVRETLETNALRQLYGMTATESAVAVSLAHGLDVDGIAQRHGVSVGTARTHLKAILVKTQTSRQAAAVAAMLRTVATLRS